MTSKHLFLCLVSDDAPITSGKGMEKGKQVFHFPSLQPLIARGTSNILKATTRDVQLARIPCCGLVVGAKCLYEWIVLLCKAGITTSALQEWLGHLRPVI